MTEQIRRVRDVPELRGRLDDADWASLEVAFLDAVRAFAQYAEENNEPSDESIVGFAIGFITGARP